MINWINKQIERGDTFIISIWMQILFHIMFWCAEHLFKYIYFKDEGGYIAQIIMSNKKDENLPPS